MLNIFIDEAGDQGFSFEKGSSRYFIIGFAYFPTTGYKDCVDSVKREITEKGGKEPQHLHFNKSSINIRKELLKRMVEAKGKFGYIHEDKKKIYDYLRVNHNMNYNYNQMVYY